MKALAAQGETLRVHSVSPETQFSNTQRWRERSGGSPQFHQKLDPATRKETKNERVGGSPQFHNKLDPATREERGTERGGGSPQFLVKLWAPANSLFLMLPSSSDVAGSAGTAAGFTRGPVAPAARCTDTEGGGGSPRSTLGPVPLEECAELKLSRRSRVVSAGALTGT